MSFMFTPFPYDDPSAVNRITVDRQLTDQITADTDASAQAIAARVADKLVGQKACLLGIDGYMSAPLDKLAGAIALACEARGISVRLATTEPLYLDEDVLDEKLKPYLPEDRDMDPVLLFGSLYHEGFDGLLDSGKVSTLADQLKQFSAAGTGLTLVYGQGTLSDKLRPLFDLRLFVDVTQKRTVLNYRSGACNNLGRQRFDKISAMLRRAYYVDFEVTAALRGQLIRNSQIDHYLTGDDAERMQLISLTVLKQLFSVMVTYPLRCRPVYLEGVWGGFYVKHLRNLPEEMKNCAWVFDLIPMEVSIVADTNGRQFEFPFYCFIQTVGPELLGPQVVETFGGYFPIRFNYDDTFHSSGNMSIQVHPPADYVTQNYNELGRQDESYYVVVTGQGAKTYIGFRDDADPEEFIEKARRADEHGEALDHDRYVHSLPSKPGMQFMLPAGTIHSSGRNQVILEIGSLTIGSYTYKMYDYMRKDLEGKLRPIHTYHGDKVLRRDFKAAWVDKNLVQAPRTIREGDTWREIIVGEHDLLYFSLRNLVFDQRIEDDTCDRFHVLALVDGEKVQVRSLKDPSRFFEQRYLDIVVVPASFGPYEIINKGVGSVVMHKTMLKEGYEHDTAIRG
ncbi:MAG: phosphoheptose isomerase [Clostridiaceae bacterium]|nr:phosphoheptose isomerase [Clostridiaceae bacterium]